MLDKKKARRIRHCNALAIVTQ